MKLPPSRINAFLTKPDFSVRVILIYGPDAGLVRERAVHLAQLTVPDLNDPFRVITLTSSHLGDDASRLRDEMASLAFGGGRRLVRIQNPSESLAGALSALLTDMPLSDSLLLIEAGDLEKRSKLRSVCEGENPLVCTIPCYVEDTAARQHTITDILSSENIRAARDVVAALAELLPPDRMAMRSELEKFAIYVGKNNIATVGDVHALIKDASATDLDDLAFAIGAGETTRVAQLIDRLYAEQTSPVTILRTVQRHFTRLHWARAQMDKGLNATEAVKRLQPPVFWKYESLMTAQLRRWSRTRVELALHRLVDAEVSAKSTNMPDTTLCAQVLLGLAA